MHAPYGLHAVLHGVRTSETYIPRDLRTWGCHTELVLLMTLYPGSQGPRGLEVKHLKFIWSKGLPHSYIHAPIITFSRTVSAPPEQICDQR